MTDYKHKYQEKCKQCQELWEQLSEFQQQSNLIINDLEAELKQLKRKNQLINRQMNDQKDKNKCFKSSIQREVQLAQRERNQFKKKFIEFEKKVIELEIVNENLQSDLRATKAMLEEYESRTEKTMEELAMAQLEIEETNESKKQMIARLKNQLKQTEQQLYALHQMKTRKQQEKTELNNQPPSQLCTSQLANPNPNAFKQTLKGIREYMANLDSRKLQVRKMLLKI